MQIKRFEARDMTMALRLVKNELGSNAVILSARNLKKESKLLGLVKSVGVEVTAAVDTYSLPTKANTAAVANAVSAYRQHAQSHRSKFGNFSSQIGRRAEPQNDRQFPRRNKKDTRIATDGLLANVFEHLVSQEVRRELAADIIARLTSEYASGRLDASAPLFSKVADILAHKSQLSETQDPGRSECRVFAVVGPSGVGKTTTIAKLAARHALQHHKAVALISLDAHRIGATAELTVYAQAIGIPFKTVATPSAFKSALDDFREFDFILVDTPGFSPTNSDGIHTLKGCLDGVDAFEIHLVLSATAKESDLVNTLKALKALAVAGLIFTKLDESCTYGNLINLLSDHPLPVSYLTSGPQVPDAIDAGSLEKIVEQLLNNLEILRGASDSEAVDQSALQLAVQSSERKFIANKNSDVFHCPDCKWTQKIKPKNLITFSSVKAAKMQDFMPCRDCQPAKSEAFQMGWSTRDSVRISNGA